MKIISSILLLAALSSSCGQEEVSVTDGSSKCYQVKDLEGCYRDGVFKNNAAYRFFATTNRGPNAIQLVQDKNLTLEEGQKVTVKLKHIYDTVTIGWAKGNDYKYAFITREEDKDGKAQFSNIVSETLGNGKKTSTNSVFPYTMRVYGLQDVFEIKSEGNKVVFKLNRS